MENFERNKKVSSDNDDDINIIGESNKYDRLIVMGDVSVLADKSNNFGNFLTVVNFLTVCFSRNVSSKTKLANDNFSNKDF